MADIFVRDANLVSLMEKTGYNITQENGQRKFGPPPGWIGPRPPKGSEIFIGKLPRDVYEDELVPLCEQFGKIYELRLMLDFNDENRGYSFVTYTNVDDATNAIKHLDDYEIRPGRHIGVCKSIDNCRLFVGGIPKDKSKEEIMAEITKCTEGVSKVILYSSIVDKSKNRGFAFVEYETHRAAAMARRKLLACKIKLFDHDIAVDWAQPEDEVEKEIIKRVDEVMDISPSHDEEPYFVQSMPFVKDHRCNSRFSSSSSASSLLETSWQYTAFRWKKRERKCTAKAAHGSQMVPSLGDFFPVMSSSDSSSSMNANVAPNETCLSYWKRTDRILCERCKVKYNENARVRFINTQCFHFFCDSCIRFLFSSENLIKPVVCITCNQRLKKLHNRYI